MRNWLTNSCILFVLITATDKLQLTFPKKETALDFVHRSDAQPGNAITNCYGLQEIRNKIRRSDSSMVLIKVLHIGDSHVKSGYFSQPFMEKLNAYYSRKYRGNLFFNFQLFCKIGTKYADYGGLAELNNQLAREKPDLVIISLGTNDAFSGSSRVRFYEKVDHLVTKIRALSPMASILLTTPSDALKKQPLTGAFTALPELQVVADVIKKYSNDHGIACWDLHQLMGGAYSINTWIQRKMVEPDRVHFTARGYKMFADWFFQAFTACMDSNMSRPSIFHF